MCHADTDGIDTLNTNKSLGNATKFWGLYRIVTKALLHLRERGFGHYSI